MPRAVSLAGAAVVYRSRVCSAQERVVSIGWTVDHRGRTRTVRLRFKELGCCVPRCRVVPAAGDICTCSFQGAQTLFVLHVGRQGLSLLRRRCGSVHASSEATVRVVWCRLPYGGRRVLGSIQVAPWSCNAFVGAWAHPHVHTVLMQEKDTEFKTM